MSRIVRRTEIHRRRVRQLKRKRAQRKAQRENRTKEVRAPQTG